MKNIKNKTKGKKKEKFDKVFSVVYYSFLGFIAIIGLLILFSKFPLAGNFKIYIVQSGSMEPAIKTGSIVIVKPQADYEINNIITFGPVTKTKPPTTHRIIDIKYAVNKTTYVTKGDANNSEDIKEVSKSNIIGRTLFSLPYAGYILDMAKKPIGFFFIIIIPALLFIFEEVKKILIEVKKLKSDKI